MMFSERLVWFSKLERKLEINESIFLSRVVVVVFHVSIVAIGHGLLKKFWPLGYRLRSTHCRKFTAAVNTLNGTPRPTLPSEKAWLEMRESENLLPPCRLLYPPRSSKCRRTDKNQSSKRNIVIIFTRYDK